MNFSLSWLKIILLVTLTPVLIAPMKIAKAASNSNSNNKNLEQHETVDSIYKTKENHQGNKISEFLVSPKGQQIEFFAFLSIIGLGIIVPELLYNPKNKNQSPEKSENNHDRQDKRAKSQENIFSLKSAAENQLENQSEQDKKAA